MSSTKKGIFDESGDNPKPFRRQWRTKTAGCMDQENLLVVCFPLQCELVHLPIVRRPGGAPAEGAPVEGAPVEGVLIGASLSSIVTVTTDGDPILTPGVAGP